MAYYHWLLIFLAGFSLFTPRVCSQGVCPKNWMHIQGSCYKISSRAVNWNTAKSGCEALGSKLAMVKSQSEQQALFQKVRRNVWIGLHRDPRDKSRWIWVDGTRVSYSHWNKGEPNNAGGNEGCGHMFPPSGKWNDLICHHSLHYLCETNVKCQKLHSLGSGVRVSPSHCRSSIQSYRSTCSFSCARGYRLSGPPSAMCGKGGVWSRQVNTIRCNVVKCPALTVNHLVKTSPNSCVTSQMKYNTKCSFTCPRGYQLQGPSFKQCRADGQWTGRTKTVSCVDINECSVTKNGGCSHKCVNTAGGYKCECPDPELNLSADNRTCRAPGVNVQCNSNNMTITIPKSLLRGIDREHLRLLDTTCKASETSAYFSLTTPLTGCKTTSRNTPTTIVYSNAVLEIPVAAKDVITRVREIEIQFSCYYSKYGVVSSVGWKPNNRKLVFNDEGKGNFTLSLNMFPDKRFVSPYMKSDFPVAVVLRKLLFFEVSVTSGDKQLSIIADRCFATPTRDRKSALKYEFIAKGCPSDVTVKYHSASSVSAQRFSLEAFKFIADHPFVFVHCHVIVCNATDPGSKCAKKCPSSGRGKREVNDHMGDDVYSLAQGPLHLAREKREEKSDSTVDKSGSSAALMIALFVMCVACLAGTASMMVKKSRHKPVGYTVLATGNQE